MGGGVSIPRRTVDRIEIPIESERDVISSDSLRKFSDFLDVVVSTPDVEGDVKQ